MERITKTVVLEELGKCQAKTITVDIEVIHSIEKGDYLTPDFHEITLDYCYVTEFETGNSGFIRSDSRNHFIWDLLDDLAFELIEPELLNYLD